MCAGNLAYHLSISLRNYWKTLRVRAVQNLGLEDSAINPGLCQMFPNAKPAQSGKPKPIPQFFEVEKVIASLGRRTHSGFQPQRILSMLVF
jgi:hypothetical protein